MLFCPSEFLAWRSSIWTASRVARSFVEKFKADAGGVASNKVPPGPAFSALSYRDIASVGLVYSCGIWMTWACECQWRRSHLQSQYMHSLCCVAGRSSRQRVLPMDRGQPLAHEQERPERAGRWSSVYSGLHFPISHFNFMRFRSIVSPWPAANGSSPPRQRQSTAGTSHSILRMATIR